MEFPETLKERSFNWDIKGIWTKLQAIFIVLFLFFVFFSGGRNSWGGFEDDYKGDVRVMQ